MLRTAFDVPALNARQRDLEQIASQPEFWNDQVNGDNISPQKKRNARTV